MPDLDKVIKGLNICLQQFNSLNCGEDCPYYPIDGRGCIDKLREDAIALLKENGRRNQMEILGQIDAELQRDLLNFVKAQEETPLPHTVGDALIADILKKIVSGNARLSGCATNCETRRMYLEISFCP